MINVHVHMHNHSDDAVEQRLERIEQLITKLGETMSVDFTKLETSLKAETDAEVAVENLLKTLTDEIKKISASSTDPATQTKLDQLTSEADARTAALTAAVVENTPAA